MKSHAGLTGLQALEGWSTPEADAAPSAACLPPRFGLLPQALAAAATMLQGDQPRCKLPAAQLLALAASRPEFVNRVADISLPALVDTVKLDGPGWGQMRQTQQHCVALLRLLIENVEGDAAEVKQSRRWGAPCPSVGLQIAGTCKPVRVRGTHANWLIRATVGRGGDM